MSYDEEFARIRGVPVKILYFGLIGVLAVTIVLMIQVASNHGYFPSLYLKV